jgi:signal transduction histidine kinase
MTISILSGRRPSVITRLMLGYLFVLTVSFVALATVFYLGTIGVLDRNVDLKVASVSARLAGSFQPGHSESLAAAIDRELTDGSDSDSEILLALSPRATRIAGNSDSVAHLSLPLGSLATRQVIRNGAAHHARLMARRLPDGGLLVVGRDLSEQEAIQSLVWKALVIGAGVAATLGMIGALLFRNQIVRRIAEIRLAAKDIEAGNFSRRIPLSDEDEFGLLNQDINRMLDRIEQLMEGVRHVSNAIAHDLRTPLNRIRASLDESLRSDATTETLTESTVGAIAEIDEVTKLFEKLLQIAEAESGMRTQQFELVDLGLIAVDIVELYDATAEEHGTVLQAFSKSTVPVRGDRNLLASAVASLVDNAIKYAGPGARIEVSAHAKDDIATIEVRDNGPGIPDHEISMVTERFYRLDRSRHLPGNGLGLSIVSAIATLHGGSLSLAANSGLVATISLSSSRDTAVADIARVTD